MELILLQHGGVEVNLHPRRIELSSSSVWLWNVNSLVSKWPNFDKLKDLTLFANV